MLAKVKTENTQSTHFRPVQENKDGRYLENMGPKPPVLGGYKMDTSKRIFLNMIFEWS